MAKINFYHGTMGSGKSLDLIRTAYNYKERGMDILVYKPDIDTREGTGLCKISTRVGMSLKAEWIKPHYEIPNMIVVDSTVQGIRPSVIIIDECQFLTEEQVNGFQAWSIANDVPLIFYGLKVDFTGHLFPGSKRLFEIADRVVELKGICHCGSVARQNARVIDGKIEKTGEVVSIGGNELYTALCNKCFYENNLG